MKMDLIKKVLLEIKEEDLKSVKDLEEKHTILESVLVRYERELKEAVTEFNQLEFLKDIKENTLKNLHMCLALPEILLVFFILFASFGLTLPVIAHIIFIVLLIPSLLDLCYLHEFVFKRIDASDNIFKRIYRLVKKCGLTSDNIEKKQKDIQVLIDIIEEERKQALGERDGIERELYSLDTEMLMIDVDVLNIDSMVDKGVSDVLDSEIPNISRTFAEKSKRLKP